MAIKIAGQSISTSTAPATVPDLVTLPPAAQEAPQKAPQPPQLVGKGKGAKPVATGGIGHTGIGKSSELAKILAQVTKEKGEGMIVRANEIPDVQRIPTGLFEFDFGTGGGFPMGRLAIIYGPESSGKTNLCMCAVARMQKMRPDQTCIWVDLEGTFDPKWATKFGIDCDTLMVVKPGYGEEAADLIDALIQADDVSLMVIDSIAVLTSAAEVENSTEKANVGREALLVKRICNKLAMAFSRENRRGHFPTVFFVNQTRFKIGVVYGDPETMPGGNTMKFMSSLTVRLYGKNKVVKELHPELPAFKDTNLVVKKSKIPIKQVTFTYDMAMQPVGGLKVGETHSFSVVDGHLRSFGFLGKKEKGIGWVCLHEEYPTLSAIEDRYMDDLDFRHKLQGIVIKQFADVQMLVEASDAAK